MQSQGQEQSLPKAPDIQPNLEFLDGLRGVAATYVMIGHARFLLWEGYTHGYKLHPELYSTWDKFQMYFWTLFKYGHEAVLVFFVLSGMVIHLRYSKAIIKDGANASFDFLPYLKRRFRRIYPPFLFSLGVGTLLWLLGSFLQNPAYTNSIPQTFLRYDLKAEYTWDLLWRNLLMLQNTESLHYKHTSVWGNNGPLWSLGMEWWFYMVYPLLFFINRRSLGLASALVLVLCFLATETAVFAWATVVEKTLSYLLIWWVGTLVADMWTGRTQPRWQLLAPFVVLVPLLAENGLLLSVLPKSLVFLGKAMGYAGLLALGIVLQTKGYLLKMPKWTLFLGKISYSVYIIHMPIMAFMCGAIVQYVEGGKQMPINQYWILLGIAVSLLAGWGTYHLTERPFLNKERR